MRDELPQLWSETVGGSADFFRLGPQGYVMRQVSKGCSALDSDQLCQIHRTLGFRQKPFRCQQYPLLIYKTPWGIRVSASFTCTSVLRNEGRPLDEYQDEVHRWIEHGQVIDLGGNQALWDELAPLEAYFESRKAEFGWEVALRTVLGQFLTGHRAGRQSSPLHWWMDTTASPLANRLGDQAILLALLKPCLLSREPSRWNEFDENFLANHPVTLLNRVYQPEQILRWCNLPSEQEGDLERFLESLWFRKFHLPCGGIMSGMVALWSVLVFHRAVARICDSPTAIELLELNLFTHSSVAAQLFPLLARRWLQVSEGLLV